MSGTALTVSTCDEAAARKILRIAQLEGPFALHPLEGGRNNRTIRLTARGGDYFLKRYADAAADGRDRLRSETAFYRYAHEAGISCIPTLFASDRPSRSALFTFVHGARVSVADIDRDAVSQAAAFAIALNRDRARGGSLPDASEAGFTLLSHYRSVKDRLNGLCAHVTHPAAAEFLGTVLKPRLQSLEPDLRDARPLTDGQRCISPSDFGFHNAIAMPDGRMCFVDFEYAGWDDPARLLSDFFLQVAVPIPACFLSTMADALAPVFGPRPWFFERIARLMPLYHVKWCCLLLSDFHPITRSRRQFAGFTIDDQYLERQLARARARYDDRTPIEAAWALAWDIS